MDAPRCGAIGAPMYRFLTLIVVAGLIGVWLCNSLPFGFNPTKEPLAQCLIGQAQIAVTPALDQVCRPLFLQGGVIRSASDPNLAYLPEIGWFQRSQFITLFRQLHMPGDFDVWWQSLPSR